MNERDRWIYELGQRHPNLAFVASDAYIERRGKDKDEITKLNDLIDRKCECLAKVHADAFYPYCALCGGKREAAK